MKRQMLSAVIIAAAVCGLCSCGNNVNVKDDTSSSFSAPAASQASADMADTNADGTADTEPASEAPAEETTEQTTSKASDSKSDAPKAESSASAAPAENSDAELISKAQELFTKACETNMRFTVGCPYSLDTSSYVENNYGWQFYLITDPNINSVADVRADYQKVFSSAYPDHLDETFIDSNGHAYCLDGARGADIFYTKSEIISVDSNNGSEIFFTVRNYYDGSDWGDAPYTKDEQFSAVIGEDGSWRAGVFTLPY